MPEVEIGKVSDFFARPVVAGVELTAPLKMGDRIHITGHTTDIEFVIENFPRTIAMANGTIIADGPTSSVLSNDEVIARSSLTAPQ